MAEVPAKTERDSVVPMQGGSDGAASAEAETPSRREFIGASSAAIASAALGGNVGGGQAGGNRPQGQADRSASNPGPENQLLANQNPNTYTPPTTDHGEVPNFWYSFSVSHRRIQRGGWSRQVTVDDFVISKDIAGVNMRLTAGGVRELHWHDAAEWSLMLSGSARITAIDGEGRSYVNDVNKGDLWYFPTGIPHSIQGLGPDGCEFLLVFDDGKFSEGNTTLLSDWVKHTPPDVLAKNWGVPQRALSRLAEIPPDGLYIFQAPVPGPLAADQRAAAGSKKASPIAFDFKMSAMLPTRKTRSGEVRIVDSKNFPVASTIAAAHVIVKPGGMREMHWHQNADEWQYYIQGKGRMTLFVNGGKARTADFNANDVGYVPRTLGHYVENTGDVDLIFLEMFKTDTYQDLSLSEWIRHTPPELVLQHLPISRETLEAIPSEKVVIAPR